MKIEISFWPQACPLHFMPIHFSLPLSLHLNIKRIAGTEFDVQTRGNIFPLKYMQIFLVEFEGHSRSVLKCLYNTVYLSISVFPRYILSFFQFYWVAFFSDFHWFSILALVFFFFSSDVCLGKIVKAGHINKQKIIKYLCNEPNTVLHMEYNQRHLVLEF
jgi:hypothetical protein